VTINRDSVLFVGLAVAQAGMTLATVHGYVSKEDAQTVAEVLAALAVAYHIPNAKAAAALKSQTVEDQPAVDETAEKFQVSPRADTV
jgi:hypothetical protein